MFGLILMIISTIIGAGFATGAELIAFFGNSTLPPVAVALIVGVFLFAIMSIIAFNIERILPVWLIKSISFVFLVAMIAGTAELTGYAFAAFAIAACLVVIWVGFEKAVAINKYLMGFALIVLLFVALKNSNGILGRTNEAPNYSATLLMALLYSAMNCFMLFALFKEAGHKRTRSEILIAGGFSAIIVSFFVLVILTAVRTHNVAHLSMPLLGLSSSRFTWFAILICIITSMYFAILGIATNKNKKCTHISAHLIALCTAAWCLSFFGFKKVVSVFYPIVGLVMIIYVLFVSFLWWKSYSVYRRTRGR